MRHGEAMLLFVVLFVLFGKKIEKTSFKNPTNSVVMVVTSVAKWSLLSAVNESFSRFIIRKTLLFEVVTNELLTSGTLVFCK